MVNGDTDYEVAGDGPFSEDEYFHDGRDWYVIHTYSGYENRVKTNLEHRIESMDAGDLIHRVIVPTVEEIEVHGGVRKTVSRKIFPGYVLVDMSTLKDNDPESSRAWFVVRNTPGVTGFVGSGVKPVALDEGEVKRIPSREEIAPVANEQLVVELYSR